MITGGFGTQIDIAAGTARNWYCGRDGVRRWADNNQPVEGRTVKESLTAEQGSHEMTIAAELAVTRQQLRTLRAAAMAYLRAVHRLRVCPDDVALRQACMQRAGALLDAIEAPDDDNAERTS